MRYIVDGDTYTRLSAGAWAGGVACALGLLAALVFGARLVNEFDWFALIGSGIGAIVAVVGLGAFLSGRRVRHEYSLETSE